jgi:hypothetical protein
MITLAMMKPIGGLLKRLDVKTLAGKVGGIDASNLTLPAADSEGYAAALEARDAEVARLGEILIVEIAMKLEDAADDLTRLCAAYKESSFEEAQKLDAFATLKELFGESGVVDFFKFAVSTAMRK